uniref:F-box domain-containing protein n=1 Tax=Meloidogyne hapla TaxID=6305 RepID=A0A1I8BR25_MELHA
MYALPLESKLDILKNLNINQLTSFRQTNHYFNALIGRYEEELARKKFDIIEFADFCCVGTHKFINIEDGVFKLEPTSQLLDKHIETSKDYSNIVFNQIDAICLKDSFTLSERAELIKKNQGEDISDNVSFSFTEYTYHLTNMHNRKVKFSIYFMELGEYKVSFRIERISK